MDTRNTLLYWSQHPKSQWKWREKKIPGKEWVGSIDNTEIILLGNT